MKVKTMSLNYVLDWKRVKNTVDTRILNESLLHTLTHEKKIRKRTKILNQKLKTNRYPYDYNHFVKLKKEVARICEDSTAETDDEPGLDHESYKKLHAEKYNNHKLKILRKYCKRKKSHNGSKNDGKSKFPKIKLPSKSRNTKTQSFKPLLESVHDSEFISSPKLNNFIDNTEERPVIEQQHETINRSEKSTKFNYESQVLKNNERDNCNVSADATDAQNHFATDLYRRKISNVANLHSEESLPVVDPQIGLEIVSQIQTDSTNYTQSLDRDSGNNSYSDTDESKECYENSPVNTVIDCGFNNKEIDIEHQLDATEEKTIFADDILRSKKASVECDEIIKIVDLENEMKIPQLEVESTNILGRKKISDSKTDNKANQEFLFPRENDKHSSSGFSIDNTTKDSQGKLKIRTIERYDKEYNFCNKYHLHKQKNIESSNNLDFNATDQLDGSNENKLSLENDQQLSCNELSKVDSSSDESYHLKRLVDNKNSSSLYICNQENLSKSITQEGTLDDNLQSESNLSFETFNSSKTRSRDLNSPSISNCSVFSLGSHDEEIKCSVKTQLLSEIDQRLKCNQDFKHNESHKSNDFSQKENSLLCFRSNKPIHESIDKQSVLGHVQSLTNDGSIRKSKLTNVQSKNSNESSDTDDLSPPPKSIKRSISNSKSDHRIFTSTPCSNKQLQLQHSNFKKQPELTLDERKSLEATSHELQLIKNKNESLIRNKQKPSGIIEDKKIRRPRNLQEFVMAEALNEDETEPSFQLKNIDDDDEIWIIEVPKTINPMELKGQTILFGGKSLLQIRDDCYKVCSKLSKKDCNISCVSSTSKQTKDYQIVNFESKGHIKFRQISVTPETNLIPIKAKAVPFPKNLKTRHPLFGPTSKAEVQRLLNVREK